MECAESATIFIFSGEDVTKKKTEQKTENQPLPDTSRRSFLNKLWVALGIVAFAELVGVVFVFFRTNKGRETSDQPPGIRRKYDRRVGTFPRPDLRIVFV